MVENNGLEGTRFGTTCGQIPGNGFEPGRMISLKQILHPRYQALRDSREDTGPFRPRTSRNWPRFNGVDGNYIFFDNYCLL